MFGGEVAPTPPPPPAFPPPHPHIKAFANRIAASIVAFAHIVFLLFFQRKVKEPIRAGPYLTSLFHYPQYWAQTRARHATEISKLLLLLMPSFSERPQVLHSGAL
jgi:hypothetical protein